MTMSNPECGLLVRPTGLPCKRWPGHLGPCIDANHITDSDPTGLFTPVDPFEFSPPEPVPSFDIESIFDNAMAQAKRLLVLVIMVAVLVVFDTASAIYLLMR